MIQSVTTPTEVHVYIALVIALMIALYILITTWPDQ